MKSYALSLVALIAFSVAAAHAQDVAISPSKAITKMIEKGPPLKDNFKVVSNISIIPLREDQDELPLKRLSSIAQRGFKNVGSKTRSAKDAQIYRMIAPSVVLISTKEGIGSGSLVSSTGEVITNFHVVKGYSTVAVIFKPDIEGRVPTRDEVRLGQVVRYDEVADLALLQSLWSANGPKSNSTRRYKRNIYWLRRSRNWAPHWRGVDLYKGSDQSV